MTHRYKKMAAKKGVSKEDLKRLMKKMKTEGTITHPLAKYNSLGNLICTVCNCQIKSDRLWNPHLLSRSHKENVSQPKPKTDEFQNVLSMKRKLEEKSQEEVKTKKPKGILKNAIPLAGYASSSEEEEEPPGTSAAPSSSDTHSPVATNTTGLPSDFFDTAASSSSIVKETEAKPSETLPEGFFDDPRADAKARNTEYVDQDEVEWSKFQSEIKLESEVSEQITAEDEFVNTEERHIEEIDEQLAQWSRVNDMVQQKNKLMECKGKVQEHSDGGNSSDADDPDFDAFLDWRSKKVIK